MTVIRLRDFEGEVPRLSERLLGPNQAQTATMCDLRSGKLASFLDRLPANTPTKSGTVNTIYLWAADQSTKHAQGQISSTTQANPVVIFTSDTGDLANGERVYIDEVGGHTEINGATYTVANLVADTSFELSGINGSGHSPDTPGTGVWVRENGFWFHWTDTEASDRVSIAEAPLAGDTSDIVVYTGHTQPRLTYSTIAQTAGTDYPMDWYDLGVPAPASAPNVAVSGSGSGDETTFSYVVTYVATYGGNVLMEGPPSVPTSDVQVQAGEQVDFTSIPGAPAGDYNVTDVYIYRLVTGETGARYRYLTSVSVGTSTATDTDPFDTSYGDVIKSTTWDEPPPGLKGLTTMSNGMIAGFVGKDVYICEPYQVHAWPTSYIKTFMSDIVGLAYEGTSLFVLTESEPHVLTGNHPANMTQRKLNQEHSCASRRSIVNMGDKGVFYAGADGLMAPRIGNVIEPWMSRKEWRALEPTSIHAYLWDGCYVFFYDDGTTQAGYILDVDEGGFGLIPLDFYATAGYTDPLTDDLYLLISGVIYRWAADFDSDTYTYKSRKFRLPVPEAMSAYKVYADDYTSLTLKTYADGVLKHNAAVTSEAAGRMATGFKADQWEIEVTGTSTVSEVLIAPDVAELSNEAPS